jgi:hypothetical protein
LPQIAPSINLAYLAIIFKHSYQIISIFYAYVSKGWEDSKINFFQSISKSFAHPSKLVPPPSKKFYSPNEGTVLGIVFNLQGSNCQIEIN